MLNRPALILAIINYSNQKYLWSTAIVYQFFYNNS